ncbi:NIF family HAD-type phosphatase [Roseateles sp. NT4]|uniref:NIF family HAD-type phosphatase n=1 Tax=Roseateles sp. NT4 TaxID=3453715 RepID=UPI003EE9F2F9
MTQAAPHRKLLILDLDETLIHATEQALDREADFQFGPYFVYRRPYLDEFIQRVARHFDLAVWTASGEVYARIVVQKIFPPGLLRFVWASRRCTTAIDPYTGGYKTIKNLSKVKRQGFDLASVVAVDDTPSKYSRSYGNLVRVDEFVGDPADQELRWLAEYLPTLAPVANIRKIEKRGWRKAIEGQVASE